MDGIETLFQGKNQRLSHTWKNVDYYDQPSFIQRSIATLESSRRVKVSLTDGVVTDILNFKKAQDALLLLR